MKKIFIPIALATIIWSACSKSDAPDSGFNSPVFMVGFEDSTNNTGYSTTAGVDGKYLFTRVDRGADEVLVMSGAFADASCPSGDCPGSLSFQFRNVWFENFAYPEEIFAADQAWEYEFPHNDSVSFKTVAIQWVTSEGRVFRSDFFHQPKDTSGASLSHFIILNSEQWETNERGENTWKMDVDFSCWVFDSLQGQERKIFGNGVIAVGYR